MLKKSADLLDVNIWLALAVEAHIHHGRAQAYWVNEAAPLVFFCRMTHLAFLRHLTNKTIMGENVLTPAEAWKIQKQFLSLPEVRMDSEPAGVDDRLEEFCKTGRISLNLWTDAYLAAFAHCGGYRLVTFDAGFSAFPGLDLLLLKMNTKGSSLT
jgi:uncharacterized protein